MQHLHAISRYQTVAASQTGVELKTSGGQRGDHLLGLLVTPASLNPGSISIIDGSTSITVFNGGSGSITTLHPFYIPLAIRSLNGKWSLTTGADVSVIASGAFS